MIDITTQLLILGGYLAVSIVVLMGCASILNFNANKRIDDFKDLFTEKLDEQNKTFESLKTDVNMIKQIVKQIISEISKK